MTESSPTAGSTRPSRLWLWLVALFVAQAVAWVIWFNIAARNPVEEVPLATPAGSRSADD